MAIDTTPVFGFKKPDYTEDQDVEVLNDNSDTAEAGLLQVLAQSTGRAAALSIVFGG